MTGCVRCARDFARGYVQRCPRRQVRRIVLACRGGGANQVGERHVLRDAGVHFGRHLRDDEVFQRSGQEGRVGFLVQDGVSYPSSASFNGRDANLVGRTIERWATPDA